MDDEYERMWKALKDRLEAMENITSFHGLQFKSPKKILVNTVLSWMREIEWRTKNDRK